MRVMQNPKSVGLIKPCLHRNDEGFVRLQSVGGHTQGVTGKGEGASVALISLGERLPLARRVPPRFRVRVAVRGLALLLKYRRCDF